MLLKKGMLASKNKQVADDSVVLIIVGANL